MILPPFVFPGPWFKIVEKSKGHVRFQRTTLHQAIAFVLHSSFPFYKKPLTNAKLDSHVNEPLKALLQLSLIWVFKGLFTCKFDFTLSVELKNYNIFAFKNALA